MHRCPNCHGAGFTLYQIGPSYDRVKIPCVPCQGWGYTKVNTMTPTQSKQAAAIMQKHGEEGWRIEYKHRGDPTLHWGSVAEPLMWNWYAANHRAVRIERVQTRTPLPIEHYKCGSVVTIAGQSDAFLVIGIRPETGWIVVLPENQLSPSYHYSPSRIAKWRWPNETEWKPAFTETVEEKIVQTLIVEGL